MKPHVVQWIKRHSASTKANSQPSVTLHRLETLFWGRNRLYFQRPWIFPKKGTKCAHKNRASVLQISLADIQLIRQFYDKNC